MPSSQNPSPRTASYLRAPACIHETVSIEEPRRSREKPQDKRAAGECFSLRPS